MAEYSGTDGRHLVADIHRGSPSVILAAAAVLLPAAECETIGCMMQRAQIGEEYSSSFYGAEYRYSWRLQDMTGYKPAIDEMVKLYDALKEGTGITDADPKLRAKWKARFDELEEMLTKYEGPV